MLEIAAVFAIVYAIEEMARVRRLKYKIWFSTAILGWLLTALLRFLTPYALVFVIIGWLFLASMFAYLYIQKIPKKKMSENELNQLIEGIKHADSQDLEA